MSAIIAFALTLVCTGQVSADFIKYKNYYIPIGQSQDCSSISETKTNVIYIDDAALSGEDPNGMLDALIVLGWHQQGRYNLLSIGSSTSKNNASNNQTFMRQLVTMSSNLAAPIPVYRNSELVDEIISQANLVYACTGERLVISSGSEVHDIRDAVEQAPEIAEKIKLYVIAGSNFVKKDGKDPEDYRFILSQLGNANVFEMCDEPGDEDIVAATNCYESKNLRYPYSSRYSRQLSDSQKRAWVDRVYSDFSSIVTQDVKDSIRTQNSNEGSGDHYLRVADYLTVAAVIWPNTDDIFRDYFIYDRLESAVKSLR